jgi:hypothetical protein
MVRIKLVVHFAGPMGCDLKAWLARGMRGLGKGMTR